MSALVFSPSEVRRLLPMETCIDLMAEALTALSLGNAVNPLRHGMLLPEKKGILGMMPGFLGSPEALGIKVVTVFPGNHGTEYDAHQGVVMLFDTEYGFPIAIADASEITALRTAAASGVATKLLARDDARDLAILGSGVQARTHLEAMLVTRKIDRVRIYSPTRENCEAFAATESKRHSISVEAASSAQEAVKGADIICTTTSSREPVLLGDWISAGVHVNAVGSSVANARELDTAAVVRSRLFVDRKESTVNEAGDYLFPVEEGAINENHICGEIGDILSGTSKGRETREEITLFKSLGVAVEDVAVVLHVYRRGREEGIGTPVELGGLRHAPV